MFATSLLLLATLISPESQSAIWCGVSILGVSLSPVFPTCLSWANLHINLKGVAVAWAFAGSACGGALYQWVSGYLFEFHGPETVIYVLFCYSILLTTVFILLTLLVKGMGRDDVTPADEERTSEKTSSETQTDDVRDAETDDVRDAETDDVTVTKAIGEKVNTGSQVWPWQIKM